MESGVSIPAASLSWWVQADLAVVLHSELNQGSGSNSSAQKAHSHKLKVQPNSNAHDTHYVPTGSN